MYSSLSILCFKHQCNEFQKHATIYFGRISLGKLKWRLKNYFLAKTKFLIQPQVLYIDFGKNEITQKLDIFYYQ